MQRYASYVSCGVVQVYDLHIGMTAQNAYGVQSYARDLIRALRNYKFATAVFSDWDIYNNGHSLAQAIVEAGLGRVVAVPGYNPNSGHNITTWLWTPDWSAVYDYVVANKLWETVDAAKWVLNCVELDHPRREEWGNIAFHGYATSAANASTVYAA